MKSESVENRESVVSDLFTASEVAQFCHVDLKTIHNWVDKGQIRHFRTPGRHLRFRRLDVIDFLHRYGYPIPESLRGGKPKVVVVDADTNVLSSVKRTLGRRFDITTFSDPIEALVTIGAVRPDVLVIDPTIAGIDGMRCIERLKAVETTAPIRIVVYADKDAEQRPALEAGASDYVPKGELGLLREAVERLTGQERT